MDQILIPLGVSLISLTSAFIFAVWLRKLKVKNEKVREIASFIRQGSMAFLWREYKTLMIFIIIVFLVLGLTNIGWPVALCFLGGALFSITAGYMGMKIATLANERTVMAAQNSLLKGLKVAFTSGSVMGLMVVGLGLFGVTIFYFIFKDPQIIYGFGFGASSVALFSRVGGGIYTKAADVGADLVGKVEKGIPEDDPRNPAVIADNVGDNVGDVAGMGADLFESYVESIIAAMVLATGYALGKGVLLPLYLAAIGIVASLIGILIIILQKGEKPYKILNSGLLWSAGIMVILSFFVIKNSFGDLSTFWAMLVGLATGILIGRVTEYYTSEKNKPVQSIAQASQTGAGTNIIAGLAVGLRSTWLPILVIAIAIGLAHYFAGLLGIAIAGVGMLSTLL